MNLPHSLSSVREQTGYVNGMAMSKSGKFMVAAVGQEHKLGRWAPIKAAKNGLAIAKLPCDLSKI